MIKTFHDAATEDVFNGVNSKAARTLQKDRWTVMRRKLDALNAATTLEDLAKVPGNRLQDLKWHRKGYYSIRINDQYRITFQFVDGAALDVLIEDYHD